EPGDAADDLAEPAGQPDPASLQRGQVDLGGRPAAVMASDQLQRRLAQRGLPIARVLERALEPAGRLEPPVDVEAAVAAGHPGVATDGEGGPEDRALGGG